MKFEEIEHGLDLNKPTAGYVRTPGLHMSDIYNGLYKKLDPKRFDKSGGPDESKMSLGTAFEELLEDAIAERVLGERPGEFAALPDATIVPIGTPNSIIFSPDYFLFNGVFRVGEFKATWMSIRHGIDDARFDKWRTQIRSYCKPLQTRYARLYVLWVNGDYSYKPPYGNTHLRAWDIEFTQKDLDTEWNTLMRFARKEGMIV